MVMMVWNFVAAHSISKATAKLADGTARQAEAESASREFARIKSDMTRLQKKVKSIEEIDSKIDVASVLAEISFLIDEKIVLKGVEFSAERIAGKQDGKPNRGFAVRVARAEFGGKGAPLSGDVRFRVVISGVAADGGDVAALICKLEDSPYFCQIYPSFSRNMKIKVKTGENLQASKFEISCYLANYRER